MARKLKSDKVLFVATILLVGLSVVMVYSASAPMALQRYGNASRFLVTQRSEERRVGKECRL